MMERAWLFSGMVFLLSHGASTSISAKKQAFLLERPPSDDTGVLRCFLFRVLFYHSFFD